MASAPTLFPHPSSSQLRNCPFLPFSLEITPSKQARRLTWPPSMGMSPMEVVPMLLRESMALMLCGSVVRHRPPPHAAGGRPRPPLRLRHHYLHPLIFIVRSIPQEISPHFLWPPSSSSSLSRLCSEQDQKGDMWVQCTVCVMSMGPSCQCMGTLLKDSGLVLGRGIEKMNEL